MKKVLILLNPFIFLVNMFNYFCHMEMHRHTEKYEPYDFSKDISYF
jgi:hypothetical protein